VGAGVPDQFIDYIETLAGEPFGYYSAIIGYSIKDEEFANKLYTSLQSENVRAWLAPIELTTGKKFRQRFDESIRLHVKLLLVLSEHSITNDWVAHLANTALAKDNEQVDAVLFPLRLDDALIEIETEGWQASVKDAYHVIDFSRWKDPDTYQAAFEWLLRDLRAEVEDLESSLFYPES
jgi:hypothetical protein